MQKTYIIIGTSAAGIAALQKIRQLDPLGRILCFSDEVESPYNKCFLADFLGNQKSLAEVYTKGDDFFSVLKIKLYLGTKIVGIDSDRKTVITADGVYFSYDRLLLAVGGNSRTIFSSKKDSGIFSFYTLKDALQVQSWVAQKKSKNIFIVGAGLTGLEVADALRCNESVITVVEQQPRLLMRQLDQEGSDFIAAAMNRFSIKFMKEAVIEKIISDDENGRNTIFFKDGTIQYADMIIETLGSSARLELAETGRLVIEKGGVVTNDFLQTSDPAIFAAGDVALVKNRITQESVRTALWPDAVAQGMCAGTNMVDISRSYSGIIPISGSTFFGLSFSSAGFLKASNPEWSEKVERTSNGYAKVILDKNQVVKGFICMGELITHMVHFKRSLITQTSLS